MKLYEACLTLLQVYSKNSSRKRSDSAAEEDQYQDLLLIMELLTNLLSKEFIDFSDTGERRGSQPRGCSGFPWYLRFSHPAVCSDDVFRNQDQGTPACNRTVSAADVVLYGVNIVLPLMTQDLLKVRILILNGLKGSSPFGGFNPVFAVQFPSLCNQYYKLITFICEIFPEKIPQLPEDLFKSLMFSLELGMTSYPLLPQANALNYGYASKWFLTLYWGRNREVFPRNGSSLACMIRMSSEISQLCLEALSPLAEQCAKSQDKDMPLFIATRHFLKVKLTNWNSSFFWLAV